MLGRVEELASGSVQGIWGGTFHSVANRILRSAAPSLGFSPSFTILDAEDAKSFLKSVIREEVTRDITFPSPAVISDIISFSRNARLPLADAIHSRQPNFSHLESEIACVAERYQQKKRLANAMDFDDLLGHLLLLLVKDQASAAALAERFLYVLVDEYQDTNPIQAEIVDRLSAIHRNLLVVGDDAQSIYSFRAASIENILRFPERYPDAKVFRLETNYRSTPEILKVANEIIRGNALQFEKTLRPARTSLEKPILVRAGSTAEEAQFIAADIARRSARGLPLSLAAVLFRATHHSQELEFELNRRGIPYEYRGGMKFFERSHIKDIIAFLKLCANNKDLPAWQRVLGLQSGIGEAGAQKIALRLASLDSLAAPAETNGEDFLTSRNRAGFSEAIAILKRVKAAPNPSEAIRAVASSSYAAHLAVVYPNAEERLLDLEEFARFAESYAEFDPFLAEVCLKDDYGAPGAKREMMGKGGRLILSTVHQAKGLEWNTVYLLRLAAGSFPHFRSLGSDAALEEERRLFYVAATRARDQLVMSYPLTAGRDSYSILAPSPFLEEIDSRFFDEVASGAGVNHRYASRPAVAYSNTSRILGRTETVWQEETTADSLDTIEQDSLGERKKPSRSRGLLPEVEDL
jgi:DNA helicase-2/ATP-dependent DNA helicase PcrA